jgi:hypothetical protein
MAMGPGVIWEIVMRSVNSEAFSQPWARTICSSMMGREA